MKRLLLLGGMTPDVTVLYYNAINRVTRDRLGGRHNAPLFIYSANLEQMVQHASSGSWDAFAKVFTDALEPLKNSIDGVLLGAILAHKVSRQIEASLKSTGIPFLHIADYLAEHLRTHHPQIHTLGLLGPKITMQCRNDPDFFIGRLERPDNGFSVVVPNTQAAIEEVNRGMLEEVARGASAVTEKTKAMFVHEARELARRGAQAIILGSTDLGFVVKQEDLGDVVVIEPAAVHAVEVAKWALEE